MSGQARLQGERASSDLQPYYNVGPKSMVVSGAFTGPNPKAS